MPLERAESMRGSRAPWKRLISASVADTPLADPAFAAALPTVGIFGTGGFRYARFIFAGTRTAADNETINYQVVGWQQYVNGNTRFWLSRVLAKGTVTLGTKQIGAAGADIEGALSYLADGVNDAKNLAGTIAHNPADNTMGYLEVDTANCDFLEVETDLGTAATADVVYQLADGMW